ncbi:MAG: S24 family peptidase [Candidatus Kapabacteria bacterium]|nr:S24 family peptidase [Candidatus Kapabacteria bacterium]
MKNVLYDRIKELAAKEKLTIEGFANKIGINRQVFYELSKFNRQKLTIKTHYKFIENGYNPYWIETGEGEIYLTNNKYIVSEPQVEYNKTTKQENILYAPAQEATTEPRITIERTLPKTTKIGSVDVITESKIYIELPMVEDVFPCGLPEPNVGDIRIIDIEKDLIGNTKQAHVLRCTGNSMEPLIGEGDLVISETVNDPNAQVKHRDIVVAYLNGGFTVKYFKRIDGKIYLTPANQAEFDDIEIKNTDDLKVVGIVKTIIKRRYVKIT